MSNERVVTPVTSALSPCVDMAEIVQTEMDIEIPNNLDIMGYLRNY